MTDEQTTVPVGGAAGDSSSAQAGGHQTQSATPEEVLSGVVDDPTDRRSATADPADPVDPAVAAGGAEGAEGAGVARAAEGTEGAGVADAAEAGPPPDLDTLSARAAERDEYLAMAQRTRADFENYRKRVAREAAGAEARATVRVVRELLPAIDNLGRALAHAADDAVGAGGAASATLAEGMRLVQGELLGAFARVGVESYEPVGEPFDPAFHEAIAQHHVPGAEPGTVVEVYQSGYRLDGSVIRPARVVVAGEAPAGSGPGPGDSRES